jgi:adenine-specific DNA-methyltransferase
MGTKRALAPVVAEVIQGAQPGVMLDAFSGMCSVGECVGDTRQVWSNDAQIFAAEVARALFTSRDRALSPHSCAELHYPAFEKQKGRLEKLFARSLAAESAFLECETYAQFAKLQAKFSLTFTREIERCRLRSPHLFSTMYAGSYFGIRQSIEIDSIVAALQHSLAFKTSSRDELRWCTIALGRALLKLSNSTGHFAQYLKPKLNNYRRYLSLRRRSVWAQWLESLADLSAVGDVEWRKENRVFNRDSLKLIPSLTKMGANIGVIYADPPYIQALHFHIVLH